MEPSEINYNEFEELCETFEPIGTFYLKDGDLWIGIDNSTGDAWTEEFETLDKCIDWLNGNDFDD